MLYVTLKQGFTIYKNNFRIEEKNVKTSSKIEEL